MSSSRGYLFVMNRNNITAFSLVLLALIIQSWLSIFSLATDDISVLPMGLFSASVVLFISGSVIFASANVQSLYTIHPRINYIFSIIGLVGSGLLLVFVIPLESLLFPRTMVIYCLIIDFFWIFLLGLLLNRFRATIK